MTVTLGTSCSSLFAWTDSSIVLSWISSPPHRWKTFVANRVSEIQSLTSPSIWSHVASGDNPADCASRGVAPSELMGRDTWWKGPRWLSQDQTNWKISTWVESSIALAEKRVAMAHIATPDLDSELISRFSSLTTFKRVWAYCFRFIQNAQGITSQRKVGILSVDELQYSLYFWIKRVQESEFADVFHFIELKQKLPPKNRVVSLNPFVDDRGFLRVGGRLRHSQLDFENKHQLLLPRKHPLTTLIIANEHTRLLHAGPQLVLTSLQAKYWIINGRNTVRQYINRCVTCFRFRTIPTRQLMGDLPKCRLEPTRPFLRSGVDYGGALLIKMNRGRGGKVLKAYICLFVCMVTKAIHLELSSDLTTETFLGALKRFIARRGKVKDIYSDNGTNFVGVDRELKELYTFTTSHAHNERIANQLAIEGISWHFIPPSAPHFGGLWEVGIKAVKHHLRRIVGNSVLTYEELYTFLTQVEACLNSRPLTCLTNDPNDLYALTPGHFLIGDSLTCIPEPDLIPLNINRLSRWQLVQRLSQQFWKRWHKEYLARLQQRHKWTSPGVVLAVGDLVAIREDNCSRLEWRLGRIIEVHPGTDGQIRVVTVKTAKGVIKRPVVKICPLPLQSDVDRV